MSKTHRIATICAERFGESRSIVIEFEYDNGLSYLIRVSYPHGRLMPKTKVSLSEMRGWSWSDKIAAITVQ
jgi:hypothetical protein